MKSIIRDCDLLVSFPVKLLCVFVIVAILLIAGMDEDPPARVSYAGLDAISYQGE